MEGRRWFLAGVLFAGVLLGLAGCGARRGGGESDAKRALRVAAAISLKEVLDEAKPELAAAAGRDIEFVFDASSALVRLISAGAEIDVFLAADRTAFDQAAEFLDQPSRRPVASNRIVMIGKDGLATPPATPAELATATAKVAVAGPKVPAGRAAREVLAAARVLGGLEGRLVNADNVRAALALVESGTVDIGFVYATDARRARHVRVLWEGTGRDDPVTTVWAGQLSRSKSAEPAEAILEHLVSDSFQALAHRHGFLPPPR